MITDVKLSAADATVRDLRRLFEDEHVQAAVIVEDGVLLAVVDRGDLESAAADDPARPLGAVGSRMVSAEADLDEARQALLASGRRRLAVAGPDGRFLGLLCLKRGRNGFCSDRDVRARGVA